MHGFRKTKVAAGKLIRSTYMDQEEALNQIADSRQALLKAIEGLDETLIEEQRVDGGWTIKDLLAHLIAWDEICLAPMRRFSQEQPFQPEIVEDANIWNKPQVERRRGQAVGTILRDLTRTRLELLAAVQRLDDAQWKVSLDLPWGGKGTVSSLLSGLAVHEIEHTRTIQKYREEKNL
jgi:uncharacterized damage-inducible protein DinB